MYRQKIYRFYRYLSLSSILKGYEKSLFVYICIRYLFFNLFIYSVDLISNIYIRRKSGSILYTISSLN